MVISCKLYVNDGAYERFGTVSNNTTCQGMEFCHSTGKSSCKPVNSDLCCLGFFHFLFSTAYKSLHGLCKWIPPSELVYIGIRANLSRGL